MDVDIDGLFGTTTTSDSVTTTSEVVVNDGANVNAVVSVTKDADAAIKQLANP